MFYNVQLDSAKFFSNFLFQEEFALKLILSISCCTPLVYDMSYSGRAVHFPATFSLDVFIYTLPNLSSFKNRIYEKLNLGENCNQYQLSFGVEL